MTDNFLGKNIRRSREKKGFSRRKLSEMLGCSSQTVYQWENGQKNPTLSNLQKLEKILETGILTKEFMEKTGGND